MVQSTGTASAVPLLSQACHNSIGECGSSRMACTILLMPVGGQDTLEQVSSAWVSKVGGDEVEEGEVY